MGSAMIYGENGWFWFDGNKYCVAITNHKILNKHFNKHKHKYPPFSEEIFYLTRGEFVDLRIEKLLDINLHVSHQKRLKEFHEGRHRKAFYNARGLTPTLRSA